MRLVVRRHTSQVVGSYRSAKTGRWFWQPTTERTPQPRGGLAIAFLDKREAIWTRDWLESEIKRRAKEPEGQLLAIFDVFDGWFRKRSFEGCSFINVLLESTVR
jgi:hypothetical protein